MSIFQDADIAEIVSGFAKPYELHTLSLITRVYRDACARRKEEYRTRKTEFHIDIENWEVYTRGESMLTEPFETIDYNRGRLKWAFLVYPRGNTTVVDDNFMSVYLKPLFDVSVNKYEVSFQLFDHIRTNTLHVHLKSPDNADWGYREWRDNSKWSSANNPITICVRFIPNAELCE